MSLPRRMRREQERRARKMDPNQKNNVSPEQIAALQEKLKEEHQMTFTKGELLVIYNVLTKVQVPYGDFKAIAPIVEKIHPIVAVDSNIPTESNGIIGAKKEVN